jgi:hypothetical protein
MPNRQVADSLALMRHVAERSTAPSWDRIERGDQLQSDSFGRLLSSARRLEHRRTSPAIRHAALHVEAGDARDPLQPDKPPRV